MPRWPLLLLTLLLAPAAGAGPAADLYARARAATVEIIVDDHLDASGFLIDAAGLVITADHVIAQRYDTLEVRSPTLGRLPARVIAREARTAQAIVGQLLDYARPGVLRQAPVRLDEVAAAVAERLDGVVVTAEAVPEVRGDRHRLEQVLTNLASNGLAFGDTVRLTIGPATDASGASGVGVRVEDDGPGVPADACERVFEPFFTTRPDGTGLGLAIARSVAQAHGGTLRAWPGPGGRFELFVPTGAPEDTDG
ncbi:MAG: HAMP domain-containing histidine kinase [Myxococcales bacterium]|nr:HAMP domain-containing histidine kinase [Myxococcales bacterium]